jgi:hypothetical protein
VIAWFVSQIVDECGNPVSKVCEIFFPAGIHSWCSMQLFCTGLIHMALQELLLKAEARNLMIEFGPKHLTWKVHSIFIY